ncbi:MAG: hypothetical protein AAFZ65_07610 [Planctomycetota bacterium]
MWSRVGAWVLALAGALMAQWGAGSTGQLEPSAAALAAAEEGFTQPRSAPSGLEVGVVEAAVVDRIEAVTEFFALLDPAAPDTAPLGVLRHVRLQIEGLEWQVERDLLLFEAEARLHTLERYFDDHCRLVHREQRRGRGGRTLRATWPLPGALPPSGRAERLREWEPRVTQWVGTHRSERRFEAARGWRGPLGLLERLRWGLETAPRLPRFEVLSGLPELVSLEAREGRWAYFGLPVRWVAFLGDEGEGRGDALFVGNELVSLSWQAGGPRAVRVSRQRYTELARQHPLIDDGSEEPASEAGPRAAIRLRD